MSASTSRRRPPRSAAAHAGARLTGGEACGRRLATISQDGLRASTGVVRAACFNILGEAVLEATVLDLFAGVGSLGLEALSRGARQVTFVERVRERAALVARNALVLGYADRAEVVTADVIFWLAAQRRSVLAADLVLMDPPYLDPGPALCLAALSELGKIAASEPSWCPEVVVEHHRRFEPPAVRGALQCVRRSHYGATQLSFYRRLP
jgi:16S rRNA (guanine966-N2)-methyltransferase